MKIQSKVYIGLVLLMFISMGAGCASTRQTTTTETTVQHQDGSLVDQKVITKDNVDEPNTVIEKSTTTIVETKPEQEHTGIIGGIFHVIGSVIALPFIAIGGLLRMIF